ncbi:hypothetical protein G816_01817 [Escherichia coli HVH 158 (4-3224287)]|nr:hypothetical protein G816_01817 [Escherichia coli HVH 158 (4-3224287)]
MPAADFKAEQFINPVCDDENIKHGVSMPACGSVNDQDEEQSG